MRAAHAWAAVSAALTLAGAGLTATGMQQTGPPAPPQPPESAAHQSAWPAPDPADSTDPRRAAITARRRAAASDAPDPLPASVPVRLTIPAIGVNTRLTSLGLTAAGLIALPPPSRQAPAGWYRYSVTPGEVGPSVILGHVDSAKDGPAVFYRLGELRTGQQVVLERADGSTATFAVQRSAAYPKRAFPSTAVYGPTDRPELRLITCGGSFDAARGHYRGNVVVFASLVSTSQAPGEPGFRPGRG